MEKGPLGRARARGGVGYDEQPVGQRCIFHGFNQHAMHQSDSCRCWCHYGLFVFFFIVFLLRAASFVVRKKKIEPRVGINVFCIIKLKVSSHDRPSGGFFVKCLADVFPRVPCSHQKRYT